MAEAGEAVHGADEAAAGSIETENLVLKYHPGK
jgi:hypothetical protein